MEFRANRQTRPTKRIAIVTMGVKLGSETKGYTRFRFLAETFARNGFEVDLITSTFQHWEKSQRDVSDESYRGLPYRLVFIEEPGYEKNLDLRRIASHRIAAKNIRKYFEEDAPHYDVVYAEIPPNDIARACAESAQKRGVPFVVDVNDLWPEAMRMVVDIPVLSTVAFWPFARDAKKTYRLCSAVVGTSDEYAARPLADREKPCPAITVYVGNDLKEFDAGVAAFAASIDKPANETWVVYAGTLGASYDLATLIKASAMLDEKLPGLRVKILGDGPDLARLERTAREFRAPVDFLGYQDYAHMAAWLSRSDITVNSLVKSAPQSIVTKIGDYLASGKPMVNTGSSQEFRRKVETDGFGVNVEAEDPEALASAISKLAVNSSKRKIMGMRARSIAESQFDQNTAYQAIVNLVQTLL